MKAISIICICIMLFSCTNTSVGEDKIDNTVIAPDSIKNTPDKNDISKLYGDWNTCVEIDSLKEKSAPAAYHLSINKDGTYDFTISAGYSSRGTYRLNADTIFWTEKEKWTINPETGQKVMMELDTDKKQSIFRITNGTLLCMIPAVTEKLPENCWCR